MDVTDEAPEIEAERAATPVTPVISRTFDQIYAAEFVPLVRLATAITGSAAAAEDVVQDAFARLYLRFGRVERPEAYLRRSVVNGCTSRFRKHRREHLVDTPDDRPASGDHTEASDRLDLAARLAALAPRQRALGCPDQPLAVLISPWLS